MREFLRALVASLKLVIRHVDGAWRCLFGNRGGDLMIDDMVETPVLDFSLESVRNTVAPSEHDLRVGRRRDAALVRIYAMKTVMTGERPALAPSLPRSIRDWLPGLDAGELKLIADATADEVLQHLDRGPFIKGLHRVQRLQPVPLPRKRKPSDDHKPSEVADLTPVFGL